MWNKIRFARNAILARLSGRNAPLCVSLHITSRCNFNCIYCYGGYAEKNAEEFTTGQIFELIEELKKRGTLWITLSGGEPLIREDIGAIIDKIKKERIVCSMNTNASLICRKIEAVKKLDYITVSLDGNEAANDMNRGEGAFKRIIEGMECLRKNGIFFDVVSVLTKHNLHSVDSLLDLAREKRFPIEFNFLQDQNMEHQDQSLFSLDDREIKSILKKLIESQKKGAPIYYSLGSRQYVLNWPASYKRRVIYKDIPGGFKPIPCYMGRLMCSIDYDGKVYPCVQLAGKFPALSFLEHGFGKCWDNLIDKKKCEACCAVCYTEFNRFFHLSPEVWINNLIQSIKR